MSFKPIFITLFCLLIFSCSHKITNQNISGNTDNVEQIDIKSWLELTDKLYARNIRSPKLQIDNKDYPIWILNKSQNLIFNFDILGEEKKDYQISIIRCDINWEASLQTIYEGALTRQSIQNLYDSYNLELTNTTLAVKESGNYLIIVFAKYEAQPIISKRFLVSEDRLNITGRITRPVSYEYKNRYQAVQYKIALENFKTNDPFEDFETVIVQNWQWQNKIHNFSPSIIQDNTLIYDYPKKNFFGGGKPFRQITIRNKGLQINDEPRSFKKYKNSTDKHGLFSIKENANYIKTIFNLNMASPLNNNEHIYIYGELSNWNLNPDFELKYDSTAKHYTASILLKEGIYDYQYALIQDGKTIDLNFIEGNSSLTTNKYHILVYHKLVNSYRLLKVKAID